ncbi:MAG: hypothetical protein SF029_17010 [bacterium]|nr:hypothetical protein [bacterium]
MRDRLVQPLQEILEHAQVLLMETDLEDLQRKFIEGMHSEAYQMFELFISIPDFTWEKAREIVSYESRSHLTSVIGYAEELLEAPETVLAPDQRERVQFIHARGRLLLNRLTEMLD